MSRSLDVTLLGGTRIIVGLSTIAQVTFLEKQISITVKRISGGSLEIVSQGTTLGGSASLGWGNGYLLETSESVNVSGPARFYLAATGATVTAGLIFGFDQGSSLL